MKQALKDLSGKAAVYRNQLMAGVVQRQTSQTVLLCVMGEVGIDCLINHTSQFWAH